MVPRAERLRRLDHNSRPAGLTLALPWRHDQQSLPDPKRPKAFHPQCGPSGIDDSSRDAIDRAVREHPGLLQRESEPRQLARGDPIKVRFQRDGLLLARAGQLHPRNGASDSAARHENPRRLIRKMRMSAKYRPGITSPGCGCALHTIGWSLASPQISFEPPVEQSSAPRATLRFTLGAGVTPAARRAGDYSFLYVLLTAIRTRVCACAR